MTEDTGLRGVVGTVSDPRSLTREALDPCFTAGLAAVELRADLLLAAPDGALGREQLLEHVRELADAGRPVIVTARIKAQGGVFDGGEEERLDLLQDAVRAGARLVDAEWGTEVARRLADQRAPLILSAHHFDDMPPRPELDRLADAMSAVRPRAIKVVPTAARLADSVTMLEWVAGAPKDGPPRIGFAMGPAGVPSRILTLSRGGQLAYAGIGAAAAPGQLPAHELLAIYRPHRLTVKTKIYGVAGNRALDSFSPYLHNPALVTRDIDGVYLPFQVDDFDDVMAVEADLAIAGLSVTIPFKEDAHNRATTPDDRVRESGAANTLVFRRDPGARVAGAIRAFNTDYDGVLVPLLRRIDKLEKVPAAIIGNGGAARGAALALREAGAEPTLYYRNPARGDPVARELGVHGRALADLAADRPRIIINATPLGRLADDPSPAPAEALAAGDGEPPRIAFEMIYEPAETALLRAAAAAGAVAIPGREMLIAQGVAQFVHFTGATPTEEELGQSYARGEAFRRMRVPHAR